MAKTKINEEGVETPIAEVDVQNPENEPQVPVKQAEAKQPQVKKVKIRAMESIDCYIANTPYRMVKDKEYSVPTDVAAILVNSRKAYKI